MEMRATVKEASKEANWRVKVTVCSMTGHCTNRNRTALLRRTARDKAAEKEKKSSVCVAIFSLHILKLKIRAHIRVLFFLG